MASPIGAETTNDLDVKELIRTVETQYMGKTSYAVARMNIITESWSREYTIETWSEGRGKFIAKILKYLWNHSFR